MPEGVLVNVVEISANLRAPAHNLRIRVQRLSYPTLGKENTHKELGARQHQTARRPALAPDGRSLRTFRYHLSKV